MRGATGSEVSVRQDAVEMPGAMALPDRLIGGDAWAFRPARFSMTPGEHPFERRAEAATAEAAAGWLRLAARGGRLHHHLVLENPLHLLLFRLEELFLRVNVAAGGGLLLAAVALMVGLPRPGAFEVALLGECRLLRLLVVPRCLARGHLGEACGAAGLSTALPLGRCFASPLLRVWGGNSRIADGSGLLAAGRPGRKVLR